MRGQPRFAHVGHGPWTTTELVAIAWIRRPFLSVPLRKSLLQVTLAGAMVAAVGRA
ncbi:MAG: hypothetical protein ACRDMH_06965 [Solirubrobacterales bacterium]